MYGNFRNQAQHQTALMDRAQQLAQNVLGKEASNLLRPDQILAFYEEYVLVENSAYLDNLRAGHPAGQHYVSPFAVVA